MWIGKVSAKAGAILLLIIFSIAVIPFGMLDAVGHAPFAIAIIGFSLMPNMYPPSVRPIRDTLLFVVTVVIVFAAYYGSYYFFNADL
jgi:hypothetical protein